MAGGGTNLAKAYVQIIPSADGIKGNLESLLGGEGDAAGKSAGGKFSSAFGAEDRRSCAERCGCRRRRNGQRRCEQLRRL